MTETVCRRRVLAAGAGIAATPVLAACGGGGSAPTPAKPPEAGTVLARTDDIAVGGYAVFPDERIVVTQPEQGDFRAFTAVCTHQGCVVSPGFDGVIGCDCHGSRFSLEDGSPVDGPADRPLGEVAIKVARDRITVA